MFGFVIGTACLVGLVVVLARGRRFYGYPGRGYGQGLLYGALARLNATPGQEKVVSAAFDELMDVARRGRTAARSTREAAAAAVRAAVFDEGALRQAYVEQDTALAEIREAAVSAGRKIHEALDERQRRTLADLIESGHALGQGHHHHHHGRCEHRGAYC